MWKFNPYNHFKDDAERGLALRFKQKCATIRFAIAYGMLGLLAFRYGPEVIGLMQPLLSFVR